MPRFALPCASVLWQQCPTGLPWRRWSGKTRFVLYRASLLRTPTTIQQGSLCYPSQALVMVQRNHLVFYGGLDSESKASLSTMLEFRCIRFSYFERWRRYGRTLMGASTTPISITKLDRAKVTSWSISKAYELPFFLVMPVSTTPYYHHFWTRKVKRSVSTLYYQSRRLDVVSRLQITYCRRNSLTILVASKSVDFCHIFHNSREFSEYVAIVEPFSYLKTSRSSLLRDQW